MKSLLVIIVVFTFAQDVSNAQRHFWMPLNGPEGGIIHSIVTNSQGDIFVSTGWPGANGSGAGRNGIYKSVNQGRSWEHIIIPFTYGREINTLAISDCDHIYAGSYYGGVYKSTDHGRTWEIMSGDTLYGEVIDRIQCLGDSVVFAGTRKGITYRSVDGGKTWSKILVDGGYSLGYIEIDQATDKCYTYAVTNFYVSSDTGKNWTVHGDVFEYRRIQDYEFFGFDTIFAATDYGEIFRSFDGGGTWHECVNGLPPDTEIRSKNILTRWGDLLFVGTQNNGMYMSSDFGSTWKEFNEGMDRREIYSVGVLNDSLVIAGTDGGVYLYNYQEMIWNESNSELDNSIVFALSVDPKGEILFAGTSGGILKSSDQGKQWMRFNEGLPKDKDVKSIAAGDDNYLLAGVSQSGIFRSLDGNSWTQLDNSLINKSKIDKILIDKNSRPAYLIAKRSNYSEFEGLLRSYDMGTSWSKVRTASSGQYYRDIAVNSNGRLFLATSTGAYYSSNQGASWTKISFDSLNNDDITVLYIDEKDAIYLGTQRPDREIYRSLDNGVNWEYLDAFSIQYNDINDLEIVDGIYGYTGVYGGVYEYNIEEEEWNYNALYALSNGYSQTTFNLVKDNEGTVYAGTSAGVFISRPGYFYGESVTICEGEEYIWNDKIINQEGTYYDSLISSGGEDSIVQLKAFVKKIPALFSVEGPVEVDAYEQCIYSTPYISGHTYLWDIEGGDIVSYTSASSVNVNWRNAGAGQVNLTVKNKDGCARDTMINVDILATRTNFDMSGNDIEVRYNISSAMLEIELINILNAECRIISIDGRPLVSSFLLIGNSRIDLSYLKPGIYIINIESSKVSYTEKILLL